MRIRWQLAITLAVLGAAAALAASVAAYSSTASQLTNETDTFLRERLTEVGGFELFFDRGGPNFDRGGPDFGRFGDDDGFVFGGPGFPFVRPDANTTYINSDGTTRASLSATDIPITDADRTVAASGTGAVTRNVTVEGRDYRVLTAPLDNDDPTAGAVQLSRDITESQNLLSSLRWRLAAITLVVTAVAAALGWTLARRLAKPLERLRNAATAVAHTKTFDTQLPNNASGEVKEVTESFNTMLAELDESRRRQHQLVQDANHELRTPLATLSANLELLERTPPDSTERAAILQAAQAELAELNDLTEQLTAAASMQYNPSRRIHVPLTDIVSAAIEQLNATTNRTVDLRTTDPEILDAAPDVMARAIFNLLANANRHAPTDTPIHVTIDRATVVVRDHGSGIADTDLPYLFEPFYRAESARSLPGSGLGLALVKQIIDDHNGTITASNHPDGGAQFTVSLPVGSPESA